MGGSSSTTTQRADPWGPAQPYIKQGLDDAGALYDAGGFNITPYSGNVVAGYDPMRAAADSAAPEVAQGGLNAANQGMGAISQFFDPNQQSAQFGQVLQNTVNQIMPQVNGSFAGSGMTGSGLHAQNLSKGVSAGVADVLNQNYQQGANRALTAAGMVPGMNNAAYGAVDFLNNQGTNRQTYNQDVINADVLADQQRKTSAMNAIQDYMSLVSGVGSAFGVQSSTSKQSPGFMRMLGFGAQALPLLFSDVRLKEDIKKVGKTDDGLGVYQYRYKAGGPVHIGLMAQEVEKKRPDAVQTVNGFKAVDYAKALER
jgi:hypothetical protein